jgi:hypothetical protein
MSSILRPLILLCAVVLVGVAVPGVRQPVVHAAQGVLDRFDKRPPKTVLILGNSRIYYHDMPDMVRAIADSAGAPALYAITTRAIGSGTLEDLWNDAAAQRLLRERWDAVILQAESAAQIDEASNEKFESYGEKLIAAAGANGSPVAVIVNWAYDSALYTGPYQANRPRHIGAIQASHRVLARRTGARLINTGEVWEEVRATDAGPPLYEPDGNHPSVGGSYLSALMIYGFLSGGDVRTATYRPYGLDEKAAQAMRRLVARHYVYEPG